MNKLGDVVFCVDCDRTRSERAAGVAAGYGSALDVPPRRMAIKRDANGEPLCSSCLDTRHDSRHAEFMLNEGRAPSFAPANDADARVAEPTAAVARSSTFIRIVRSRAPIEAAAPPAVTKSKPLLHADTKPAPVHAAKPVGRRVERQFVMLVVEIGFLRAQQLLDQLDARGRELAGSAARVSAPKRAPKRGRKQARAR